MSGAVALGIVAMLLAGFFIGRGTRLSNESVQSKITQQSQSDQIAEQQALDNQSASLKSAESRAVASARRTALAEGRQEGFTAGQENGFRNGHEAGYNEGNATGIAQGETHGFSEGLNQGACLANTIYCSGG
jgi:flagellar biosynthesis/type III secretory pathway protein FliH